MYSAAFRHGSQCKLRITSGPSRPTLIGFRSQGREDAELVDGPYRSRHRAFWDSIASPGGPARGLGRSIRQFIRRPRLMEGTSDMRRPRTPPAIGDLFG